VVERETRPAVEAPAPRQVPVESVAPVERAAPAARSEPATAPAAPSRVEPVEAAPRAAPPATAPGTAPAREPARPAVSPADSAPRGLGPSAIDDEVFRGKGSVIAPSSDPAAAPRIDLEATRRRAREIAAEGSGSPGVLPVVPLPPEKVKKPNLAEAIAKAAKPDCRTAYSELGLLAIPPLVASTVGDGGCRW
jgi:hypothetical protein